MKRLGLLALATGFMLGGCAQDGSTQETRPYSITIKNLAYSIDKEGVITIKEAEVKLFSAAGAPDVRSVTYTAQLFDTEGNPAADNNSEILAIEKGSMYGSARGGYICTTTKSEACGMSSADAVFVNTGPEQWNENLLVKAIMPVEWARAHSVGGPNKDSAGWSAKFTFKAVQSNGKVVEWNEFYQIVAPA